jgi:hypothetical protein
MKQARKCKFICLVVSLILSGCTGAPDLPTPDKIGEKERLRVISGQSFGTTLPPQLLALYPI